MFTVFFLLHYILGGLPRQTLNFISSAIATLLRKFLLHQNRESQEGKRISLIDILWDRWVGEGVCSSGVSVQRMDLKDYFVRLKVFTIFTCQSDISQLFVISYLPKAELIFSLKSFHWRQSFSDILVDAIYLHNLLFYDLRKKSSDWLILQKICCLRQGIHKKTVKITLSR